jgi:hypothetical protein
VRIYYPSCVTSLDEEMNHTPIPRVYALLTLYHRDLLKIVGLDRRILHGTFTSNEESRFLGLG